ncbi:excalibur calcium-binding domain-containing protein [Pelagibacterium sp. H642]|uniref:excalibur calcium-binding domain-containing protein n=1 Tax=Pelagibacterium sp. H642 TaxID=1881069 RepID=UPI0028169361|nr:excalibur calcium-binding domain-containing protein [Pelagibacterium sp. H642]
MSGSILSLDRGEDIMRYFLGAIAVAICTTISTHTAFAQRDMDCSDFRSWSEAQAFYERQGPGDPHRLDADNDGIACEALR